MDKFKNAIHESDLVIAIVTENFMDSSWTQAELSSVIFSSSNINLIPIVVGDVFLPEYLSLYLYRRVDDVNDVVPAAMNAISKLHRAHNPNASFKIKHFSKTESSDIINQAMKNIT